MRSEKITAAHLSRTAYVYVRQSTQHQVEHNLETRDRQYQLVDKAKAMGFANVTVIRKDLGASGSIGSERSGFKKLVAEVSLNKVGMVLGIEVSRFARNNRDWYHLLDLCALFNTLIADQDGVYDPGDPNDRMVLGPQGNHQRSGDQSAEEQDARGRKEQSQKRRSLIYRLPVGYLKTDDRRIEKDPESQGAKGHRPGLLQVQGESQHKADVSVVYGGGIDFPAIEYGRFGKDMIWRRPVYNTIHNVLTNPVYAGALSVRAARKTQPA